MLGLSGEHVLVLFIVLLVFGPKKLPELGNTLGKAMKNFRDGVAGVEAATYRHLPEASPAAPGGVTAAPNALPIAPQASAAPPQETPHVG